MSEGGGGAGRSGAGRRGQDGVGGAGMSGCYEGMVGSKFCPELSGGLGEGIILAGEQRGGDLLGALGDERRLGGCDEGERVV
jgi:hypothetical protein